MSFLFPQKRPKTLSENVYALNEWIVRVNDPHSSSNLSYVNIPAHGLPPSVTGSSTEATLTESQKQAVEESGKLLAHIRRATWALPLDSANQPEPDQLTALAKEVYSTDVFVPLLQNLRLLEFDAKRDVASFFGYMLKRPPTIEYLLHKVPEVFTILLASAGDVEIHRTVCQILRECARHEALVAYALSLQNFWWFFQYIDDAEFEVATDNFSTFQDFLRNYPDLTTQFLLRNAGYFTQCINGLINSPNYVAKRQSLRLLFQLIKQQRNHQFLLMYVDNLENLKLNMRMLKDKSKNIHFEAFQIFKIFVANPNKPKPILDVLVRNKSKLLDMLDKTHTLVDRREDQAYQKERDYVKAKILALPDRKQSESSSVSSPERSAVNLSALNINVNAANAAGQHTPQPHTPQQQQPQQQQPQQQNSPTRLDPSYMDIRPRSPSRARVPPAVLDARPASPIMSNALPPHFPPQA